MRNSLATSELLEVRRLLSAAYSYDLIAKSGGAEGLTSMNTQVSINDAGTVAFIGQKSTGSGVYVGKGSSTAAIEASKGFDSPTRTFGFPEINNTGQVSASERVSGSPPSYVIRKWDSTHPGTFSEIAFAFDGNPVLAPTISNDGTVSYLELDITGGGTLLQQGPGPINLATYAGTIALRPMAADNGAVVVLSGATASSPVIIWSPSGGTLIAGASNGFSNLGQSPGISDDGKIVAFYGNLSAAGATALGTTSGPGIFASIAGTTGRTIVRIAGLAGNHQLDPGETYVDQNKNGKFDPATEVDSGPFATTATTAFDTINRIGVNDTLSTQGGFTVVFGGATTGKAGLFSVRITAGKTAGTYTVAPAVPVLLAGDTVAGVSKVRTYGIYDPINNTGTGQIAFWISNGTTQAVIRASAPAFAGHVHAVLPNKEDDPLKFAKVIITQGTSSQTTFTDANGDFSFTGLTPGTATLEVDLVYQPTTATKPLFSIYDGGTEITSNKPVSIVDKTVTIAVTQTKPFDFDFAKSATTIHDATKLADLAHSYFEEEQYEDCAYQGKFDDKSGLLANLMAAHPLSIYEWAQKDSQNHVYTDPKLCFSAETIINGYQIFLADRQADSGSSFDSPPNLDQPMNSEWHETSHYFQNLLGDLTLTPQDINHNGYLNPDSADSFKEGFAEYLPCEYLRLTSAASPSSYKLNGASVDISKTLTAWSPGSTLGDSSEEFALASLLWSITTPAPGPIAYGSLSLLLLLQKYHPTTVASLHTDLITAKVGQTTGKIGATVLDDAFISHGFFADPKLVFKSGLFYLPNTTMAITQVPVFIKGDIVGPASNTNPLNSPDRIDRDSTATHATTSTVATKTSQSTYGQAVTFTATVVASGIRPTGTVTFLDGNTVLGTAILNASGVATFTTPTGKTALAVGIHTIKVVYLGDASCLASVSKTITETVAKPPTSKAVFAGIFSTNSIASLAAPEDWLFA